MGARLCAGKWGQLARCRQCSRGRTSGCLDESRLSGFPCLYSADCAAESGVGECADVATQRVRNALQDDRPGLATAQRHEILQAWPTEGVACICSRCLRDCERSEGGDDEGCDCRTRSHACVRQSLDERTALKHTLCHRCILTAVVMALCSFMSVHARKRSQLLLCEFAHNERAGTSGNIPHNKNTSEQRVSDTSCCLNGSTAVQCVGLDGNQYVTTGQVMHGAQSFVKSTERIFVANGHRLSRS